MGVVLADNEPLIDAALMVVVIAGEQAQRVAVDVRLYAQHALITVRTTASPTVARQLLYLGDAGALEVVDEIQVASEHCRRIAARRGR